MPVYTNIFWRKIFNIYIWINFKKLKTVFKLPRTNWNVVRNKYSKNETTNSKEHEKQENKKGGRKNTFLLNTNNTRKGKLLIH